MLSLRRGAIAAAAAVVAALLGPANATSAAPPKEAAVRATINDAATAGRVISARPACERGVGVVLVNTTTSGGVNYRAQAATDDDGRWRILLRRGETASRTFAVVPGDTEACAPAQSDKVATPYRAAGPAAVRVSLRYQIPDPARGRVSSPRAACERGADVLLFFRRSPREPWQIDGLARTDRDGRYTFGGPERLRRGDEVQFASVALASRGCEIAQSETVRPS